MFSLHTTSDCENTTLQDIPKKIEEKVQFLLSLFVIEGMEYIQAQNRLQMQFSCLEEQIGDSNSVRVLEAFVNKLDLEQLQFTVASLKTEGRPPFHPTLFLKLYLYGYLNVLEKVNGEHSLICLVYNLKKWLNYQPKHRKVNAMSMEVPKTTEKVLQKLGFLFCRLLQLSYTTLS